VTHKPADADVRPLLMMVTGLREGLPELVAQAVAGGVNIVQFRDNVVMMDKWLEAAATLREVIAPDQASLVLNTGAITAWLTEQVGADGVHLPECESVGHARLIIGAEPLIGQSVHSVEAAVRAQDESANYVVAGTIFASASHPERQPAGLEYLREVCAAVSIPVLAIGGITPERAGECIRAGARGVAVLSPFRQADDPGALARAYRAAMEQAQVHSPSPPPSGTPLPLGEGPGVRVGWCTGMIEITVNGMVQSLEEPLTLSQFLARHELHERRVVVERNGEIVPRDSFEQVTLANGDVLEIVHMMAGG
jgi:thiamine-phosphate pyrophosphorylase